MDDTLVIGVLIDLLVFFPDDMLAVRKGDEEAVKRIALTSPYSCDDVVRAVDLYERTVERGRSMADNDPDEAKRIAQHAINSRPPKGTAEDITAQPVSQYAVEIAKVRLLVRCARIAALNTTTRPARPGDLVVETTTRGDEDSIGWLIAHGDAPVNEDGTGEVREIWDVVPLTGFTVKRWENASFLALPESVAELAFKAYPRSLIAARQICRCASPDDHEPDCLAKDAYKVGR